MLDIFNYNFVSQYLCRGIPGLIAESTGVDGCV